jgi:hypothetical protein
MKAILKLKWFMVFALLVTGCYYDNEEDLYGTVTCTPNPNASFTVDVLPILNIKCNNCHAGTSPSGGIKLNSYTEVIKYVEDGSLMGSINHASGYSAMPKNGGKLPPCEIQVIQDWIDAGALNN